MHIEIVGKDGYVVSETVKDYLYKRLAKPIKMFNPELILSITVVLKSYSNTNKVEVTMPCKGITIRSETSDPDMLRAIDFTVDKMVAQIRKHKTKLKDHFKKQGIKEIYTEAFIDNKSVKEEVGKKLSKRKNYHLLPMSVNEAILEMEMVDHDFYVFLNEETNQVNVCYRRKDGDYALIETYY